MIPPLAQIAEKGLMLWLALMALAIGWKCLSGGIGLGGILAHDACDCDEQRPAPERVQMLIAFVFALAAYARLAIQSSQAPGAPLAASLPEAPNELVALFLGSHSIYLAGKFGRSLARRGKQP
ncbi:MAG TPA: hypothetical protein VHC42_06530 [Rhizomicrobium sp.]|jgi:hypothetical protein|nr:hypothetical protein [Rhizomicrobium sp.]